MSDMHNPDKRMTFTCPKCGGTHFGTYVDVPYPFAEAKTDFEVRANEIHWKEHAMGTCHGPPAYYTRRLDTERRAPIPSPMPPKCNFTWRRRDDALYFKETP